jgi:hypothetical protein
LKRILLCLALLASAAANAGSTGLTLTLPIIGKDPSGNHSVTHGYRAAIWYQPDSFIWKNLRLFFDASFGHWWVNGHTQNKNLNIFSLAPTLRFYIMNTQTVSPFIDLSIGVSYLSNTRLDHRNLGEHFSFQDQVGLGATLGREQRLSASLSAMHYSNGSFCKHNIGITIPLLFNISYRFM